jgi:hypothetical protein
MAGGSIKRDCVGLYAIGEPEVTADGFRFVIDDSGLSRRGFAYSAAGEPELTESNYSPLWTGTQFQSIGGGWWYWTEGWD